MTRRFEQLPLSQIEAHLAEIEGASATRWMPARPAPVVVRTVTASSLETLWLAHLLNLGATFAQVWTVGASVDARRVRNLEVRCGLIAAEQRAARVEIEVEPPSGDLDSVRDHLAGQARAGRESLREALRQVVKERSRLLLPAHDAIRPHCTCRKTRKLCRHVLGVLAAFAARLDAEPGLLVRLRGLEALDLRSGPLLAEKPRIAGDLAAVFGIDLEEPVAEAKLSPPPSQQKEVGREHLRVLGLRARTIDAWLRDGILGSTGSPDVYLRTAESNRRIALHLAR